MILTITKRILFYLYLIRKTNWVRFIKNYSSSSDTIFWIFPSYPKRFFSYFVSSTIENDFALLNAILEKNIKFSIKKGQKNIFNTKNKTVIYNISNLYNIEGNENYAASLLEKLDRLEANQNTLIPNRHDAEYWENKGFMQRKFNDLGISHPKTYIIEQAGSMLPDLKQLPYPVIYKPLHGSGSTGILEAKNATEMQQILDTNQRYGFLLQERIEMRRDLRVIFVGDELVLHYWRINKGKDWRPTSTGHGSSVDFDYFPEQWRDFIFNEYKKLNIHTGAFDITWKNDNMDNTPLILEVSPSYLPNPPQPEAFKNLPYSIFKKKISGNDAYFKKYINLVFEIKIKFLNQYL